MGVLGPPEYSAMRVQGPVSSQYSAMGVLGPVSSTMGVLGLVTMGQSPDS
jgi:hypothetical protein